MENICAYGCGAPALYYVTKLNKPCCSDHFNKCTAVREKNADGVERAYKNGTKISFFTDTHRAETIKKRKDDVVNDLNQGGSYRSNHYLRKIIREYGLLEYKCTWCDVSSWRGDELTLELDHIDGQAHNCKLDNLRFLCPNCHSQTKTYKGRNMNSGKKKVSDEVLLASLRESDNIRQALIRVGLSPRGGNYTRAAKLNGRLV